jgi:hypothetical protein
MQPEQLIVAIDPGKEGGIAWGIPPKVANLATEPGDLLDQLTEIRAHYKEVIVYVEQVGGYVAGQPQPGSAMFKFGKSVGMTETAVTALGFTLCRITPQKWQGKLGMRRQPGEKKDAFKRRLRARACELYPALRREITVQVADAVLMLWSCHERNPPSPETVP